ncbi:MAG: TRAP transporter substrate-binding protein DctP [Pikeienuella sp.]
MKHLIAGAVAALLAVTAADARELRSSGAPPAGTPWGKITDAFAAKVAELSGGSLTIKHFHANQLGDEQTTIRQVARGRLDMGIYSNTASSLLVPEFGLLGSPFAFNSLEQADCVADNHLLKTFGGAFESAGVQPIGWLEVGQQIIFAKEPIISPSDLEGVKIRTAPTKTDTLFMEAAGGAAVPLGTTDAMPALKTGNVSAATWPAVYGIAVGYHKVAPHVTTTNHVHQIGSIVVSGKTWKSLSAEEQGWMLEAAEIFKGLRKGVRGAEAALLKKIQGAGATVHASDDSAWRAIAPKVQPQIVSELGGNAEATWAAISSAKAACGG